jgi:phosphoglycolate phosphatase-like HAD superfamily hydrolase
VIRRVLLWDVDGTLVRAGELGAAVFDRALEEALGRPPDVRVRMSGKTDPQIVREYLVAMGIEERERDEKVAAVLRRVEHHLAAAAGRLAAEGMALAGVPTLLETLAADRRIVSTVLTGNIAPNAVVKLAAFGLDRWLDLEVGAYGSDDPDRRMLVPVALGRIAEQRGARVDPDDVWVIGDTPLDLACAQAAGAHSLLVATGRSSAAELARLGADAVLDDLRDTAAVVKLLTGDLAS